MRTPTIFEELPKLREKLSYRLSTARGVPIEYDLRPWRRRLAEVRTFDCGGDLAGEYESLRSGAAGAPGKPDLYKALALAVEASRRALGLEPFEGQIIAALALLEGRVTQLQTGEGKTLVAALAASAAALRGEGVHVLTANDYLARRDAAWMGPLYALLGLRALAIGQGDSNEARRAAYDADITYLTARECGFDYLSDQLRSNADEIVQRVFGAAIVDEADFILVDEARVPLVIAGESDLDPREALAADAAAAALGEGPHYGVDREGRRAPLTAAGRGRVEEVFGAAATDDPVEDADRFYGEGLERFVARVHAALVARRLLARDVDYIVRKGRVELVDGFTGRVADRRKWPWGVQAALEAKEGLEPGPEGRVYGTITVQHLLALYPRLAAMTATAVPAAAELSEGYGLPTLVVPPEKPLRRIDAPDLLFATAAEKRAALLREIEAEHRRGRPVLVGTASVLESRELAAALEARGLAPRVLNALNDEAEAEIIAEAGSYGALTISTNMAGRGTDIRLGGSDVHNYENKRRVEELGGLYVIGTNRHESRRVDQQLRGRAGRQGEPGLSRFFISLEDPLFTRYGVAAFLPPGLVETGESGKPPDADAEAHPIADRGAHREVRRAQAIIEGQNRRLRMGLRQRSLILEYDRRHVRELRDRALREGRLPPEIAASLPLDLPSRLAVRAFICALDRFWADQLDFAEELAEGRELSRLGGRDPDVEYLGRVAERYEKGLAGLGEACATLVAEASKGGGPIDEAAFDRAGIRVPSTTWTYQLDEEALPPFLLSGLSVSGNLVAAFAWPVTALMGLLRKRFQSTR
jgi:preprotein translocase subunit SecA